MYFQLVAGVTRDHLREHLVEYLAEAKGALIKPVDLPVPKSFEVASFVGGVTGLSTKGDFPVLAIDAFTKVWSPSDENLYTYRYDGAITWMVAGANPIQVESQAKGYHAALEMFLKRHQYSPYASNFDESTLPFLITELAFMRGETFGASNIEASPTPTSEPIKLWVDGGRIDVAWTVSEDGTGQHDG